MNHLVSVRITKLFSGQELLACRMLEIVDQFRLEIAESDIIDVIASINTSVIPDQTPDMPSDSEFMSILVFVFVQSYIEPYVCTERYLDYLDRVFQYKFRSNKLRIADILFYDIFTERMNEHR